MNRKGALCVWGIVICSAWGAFAGDGTGLPPLDIPRSAAKAIGAKRSPVYPSLDAGLNRVLAETDPLDTAEHLGFRVRDGRIQIVAVVIEGSADELMSWLATRDAVHVSSAGNLVQAFVPPHLLDDLEGHHLVRFVRKPDYIVRAPEPEPFQKTKTLVTYTSQGVAAMNADAWHGSAFTGQGIRIGVIDVGYQGYSSLLGTELPAASKVFTNSFGGTDFEGDLHGSACAEIVYDVTPGISQMYLAAVTTGVDTANAFAWLEQQDVDIISMSMSFGLASGPGDGTGPLADLIDAFVASNRMVVISAGNSGQSHWQGTWSDGDGDNWLDFASGNELNSITDLARSQRLWIPADTEINATLVWNQWNAPTTDFDFCLYRWDDATDPATVACSDDLQNGQQGQYPRELITHTVVEEGYYAVGVFLYSGNPNVDIELEIRDAPVQFFVESGSILVPADTASALTVGALDAGSPYPLEYYSSLGPTNGFGGALNGGFIKPDIAGYANVSTSSYGPRSSGQSFNGTSAACPHVAGAAALVWSANPSWTVSQVRTFLESSAIDKGPSGRDNTYGYGRLYLGSPPASCSYSISPTSRTIGASGGSASFSVSTQSGCSWTASTSKSWIHITGGSSGNGNGSVSYSVDSNSSTSQRSGTIEAAGKTFTITQSASGGSSSPGDNTYYAVIAHTTGTNDSVWKSSLSVCNVSSSNASVVLTYHYGASGRVARNATIAPFGLAEWSDAAVDLFNVGGKSSGVVTIESDARLLVAVRTFNSSVDGTFGQSLPGASSSVSMTKSQFGIISPVKRTSQFRTNIGVINTGSTSCRVTVTFGNTDGWVIGDSLTFNLAPGEWQQTNEALKKAGISRADAAIALVQLETTGAEIWAYATVIDNSSGDPTALGMAIFD